MEITNCYVYFLFDSGLSLTTNDNNIDIIIIITVITVVQVDWLSNSINNKYKESGIENICGERPNIVVNHTGFIKDKHTWLTVRYISLRNNNSKYMFADKFFFVKNNIIHFLFYHITLYYRILFVQLL